jgi:hypothetical protein
MQVLRLGSNSLHGFGSIKLVLMTFLNPGLPRFRIHNQCYLQYKKCITAILVLRYITSPTGMVRYRLKTNLKVLVHLQPFDGARTPRLSDTLSNNPIINHNITDRIQKVLFLVFVVNI